MNEKNSNTELVKRFNPIDMAATAEVLAEDFVWHYYNPELLDLQGDYVGITGLTDFFNRMAGNTKGTFSVNPISIIPMGDELVVVHVKDNMLLNGRKLEIDAIVVWRIVEGKIKEAWDIPAVNTAKVLEL